MNKFKNLSKKELDKYNNYTRFIGEDLYDYALKHTKKEYANALLNIKHQESNEFIKNNIGKGFSGDRPPEDVLISKVYEELLSIFLIDKYKNMGYNMIKNGCEGEQLLIKIEDATSAPDFILNGHYVELQSDSFGSVRYSNCIYFRLNKLKHLLYLSKNTDKKVYVLYIDIYNKHTYSLIINEDIEEYMEYHKCIPFMDKKFGYSLDANLFKKLDFKTN